MKKREQTSEEWVKEHLDKPKYKLEHKEYFVAGRKVVIDRMIPYNQEPIRVATRSQ